MTFGKAVKSNVLQTSRITHNLINDVFISNNIINIQDLLKQPGPSCWIMNLDGWPKALAGLPSPKHFETKFGPTFWSNLYHCLSNNCILWLFSLEVHGKSHG